MFKITLLLVVLTAIAQVFPSCGSGGDDEGGGVVGWVEMKKVESAAQAGHAYVLVINSTDYEVPGYFWQQVDVGDLVKWDGRTWTIVKRSNPQKPLPNPG
jgi:hypothetical protein